MIIYIHGFGSSGHGGKASLFREYFEDEVIAPSLSYVPNLAIDTLEQLIEMLLEKGETVGLVGSSLGGYYSIYLANKYDLKAVLINPAIYPYKTLDKIDVSWENTLNMKVNKYISASIFLHTKYDHDIDVTPDDATDLTTIGVQRAIQFKNVIGIGLAYKIGDSL